ncbi:MAG: hypothetical protein AAGG08_05555 [Actinomycetota bacterium]
MDIYRLYCIDILISNDGGEFDDAWVRRLTFEVDGLELSVIV